MQRDNLMRHDGKRDWWCGGTEGGIQNIDKKVNEKGRAVKGEALLWQLNSGGGSKHFISTKMSLLFIQHDSGSNPSPISRILLLSDALAINHRSIERSFCKGDRKG